MHRVTRKAKIKATGSVANAAVMGLLEQHGPDKIDLVKGRGKRRRCGK